MGHMKKNYTILGSREIKVFFKELEKQFGKIPENFKELVFIKGKEKVYIITRDIDNVNMTNIRINSIGLYIVEIKNEQLRLSIEGAQLIGPHATKNVCELTKEQLKKWFKGEDIQVEGQYEGFVILKYENDYVGSGRYSEGTITNFVPKARRILEMH